MNYRWIILIFFCITQLVSGGSILSSHGIGLPYDNPTVRAMGMGDVSLANPSSSRIDHTNPAGLAYIQTTQLMIQSVFHRNQYRDQESEATSNYANFDGFHFAIPFGKGLTTAFGIKPVTRIDYRIAFTDEIDSQEYTRSLEGSGGINRFALTASWTPVHQVSVGVRTSFILGRIIEESRNRFPSGSGFTSSHDRVSTYANGLNWTIGILVRPTSNWTLGGIFSPKARLDTDIDLYQIFNSSALEGGSIQYPATYGVGTSCVLFKKLLIGLDVQTIQWAQLKINESGVPDTQNSTRLSFGLEKLASTTPYVSYFKRIPVRAGIRFQPYYILDPDGNTISELWGTFGFGLPLFHNSSHIDFMIGYGRRGSLETNGLKEDLIRFGLSVTGGEKWFVRKY